MVGQILKIISEGRVLSVDKIAAAIGVSPQITEAMIEDLVRRGYLVEASVGEACSCGRKCAGCQGGGTGGVQKIRFWSLAKKKCEDR